MLSTMRTSWLFFALFALVALSSALTIEEVIHLDGIEAYLHHGEKRQAPGTGSSTPEPTPTDKTTSDPPSNTPTPESTPEPTPTKETTTNEPEPTPTSSATPTSTPTREGSTSSAPSTSNTLTSDAPSPSKTQTPVTITRPLLGTSTRQYTTIITTVSNGQNVELTSVATSTGTFTTGSFVETTTPLPQDGNSSGGGGGGLSDNSKKIIGGVVGGVGGAILLGGIALVCWRIWGRKNRVSEDDADLMANTGAALGDKPQNNASPFQSNLEQYHNPSGRPNAAANF